MLSCEACGKWHQVSPTGMAIIIHAYTTGMMQTIGKDGVTPVCFIKAFDDPEIIAEFRRRYAKNTIRFDGQDFTTPHDVVFSATLEETTTDFSTKAIRDAMAKVNKREE